MNVPTTRTCFGQSFGFGTNDGDHIALNGIFDDLIGFAKFNTNGIGGKPNVLERHLFISAPKFVHINVSNAKYDFELMDNGYS